MEISHLIVVDNNHHGVAMLTRGSLLPWCVEEEIGHQRMNNVRSTIQRPRSFRPEGITGGARETFWSEQLHCEADTGQLSAHDVGSDFKLDYLGSSVRPEFLSSEPHNAELPSASSW